MEVLLLFIDNGNESQKSMALIIWPMRYSGHSLTEGVVRIMSVIMCLRLVWFYDLLWRNDNKNINNT